MVLTSQQQQRLCERLAKLSDVGGVTRVAELAGVTCRVIQKAQTGGNVRVKTMESIMQALQMTEAEREVKIQQLEKALA